MQSSELCLKDRTEIKTLMDQVIRGGTAVKRAAHRFEIDEAAHLQMQTLVILVGKAAVLMGNLKPKPEDSTQQIVSLDLITTNGPEENYGATDHGN